MIKKILILGFLLPLLITAGNGAFVAPGEEMRILANYLSECMDGFAGFVSVGELLECVNRFIVQFNVQIAVDSFQGIAKQIYIKQNDYKNLPGNSERFNALLLDIIVKQQPDIITKLRNESLRNKKGKPRIRKLVQDAISYQNYYCDNLEIVKDENFDSQIKKVNINLSGISFELYVYSSNDIVSNTIARGKGWESTEVNNIINGLKAYRKKHNVKDPREVTFLDIGGQIGWHSLMVGYNGYKVYTFEPMQKNQYIFRHSICLNRSMSIIDINKGLGDEEKVCYLYSQNTNEGDPSMFCDTSKAYKDYTNRGYLEVLKLDDFVDVIENLAVIKMDIEGSEYLALKGGREVLLKKKIPYIVTEFSPKMLRDQESDPIEYVQEFINAGYVLSTKGFDSDSLLTIEDIKKYSDKNNRNYRDTIIDLYFTYKNA